MKETKRCTAALLVGWMMGLGLPNSVMPWAAGQCQDGSIEEWSYANPLPSGRAEMTCSEADGSVYVIGTRSAREENDDVLRYNPATDLWTQMADMPTARWHAASATMDGVIYVFGGNNSYCCNNWLTTVEAYDTETDAWTAGLNPIPGTERGFLTATPVGKHIYVMGGSNSYVVPTFSDNFVYDPNLNQWSAGASMPRPRSHHCSVELDGKIYLVGGEYRFQAGQTFFPAEVDVYDPATNTWSLAAPFPHPGHFSACEVVCGKIHVLGEGIHGAPGSHLVHVYDPAADSWSAGVDLPEAKGSHCSAVVDDTIYAIGGGTATLGFLDTVVAAECTCDSDSDGDGVADDEDACPESVSDEVIVINQCDSGVANRFFADGCNMMDEIAACEAETENHGQFVRCVVTLVRDWRAGGLMTAREGARIIRCVAGSNRPRNSMHEISPTIEAR